MPNKTWTLEVDLIPSEDGEYNLGNASKKWNVNGYLVNEASAKQVDTAITSGSTSTKLPTTAAVVDYVDDATEAITNEYIDNLVNSIYGS